MFFCHFKGLKIPRCNRRIRAWVVQSKAVSGDRYIGPNAIKEVINALTFYGTNIAAVATNGEFTQTAIARQKQLEKNGYTLKLWNGTFIKSLIERMPSSHAGLRSLRPYQEKIVNKVVEAFNQGEKRAFYIVATGLGKTVIAATIARHLWEKGCHRILVLCHATDLAIQLESGFWPQIPKEIPTSVFFNGLPPRNSEGIAFGLYQSLYGYLSGIANPKIAIFSPSIEHSHRFANMLSASGVPCVSLSCSDKAERRKRLLSFATGNVIALTAVDVMNEGIDIW